MSKTPEDKGSQRISCPVNTHLIPGIFSNSFIGVYVYSPWQGQNTHENKLLYDTNTFFPFKSRRDQI